MVLRTEKGGRLVFVHTSCAFHAGHHAVGLVVRIRRERGQAPHGAQIDADGKIKKELPVLC